jgi:hypothetical protein
LFQLVHVSTLAVDSTSNSRYVFITHTLSILLVISILVYLSYQVYLNVTSYECYLTISCFYGMGWCVQCPEPQAVEVKTTTGGLGPITSTPGPSTSTPGPTTNCAPGTFKSNIGNETCSPCPIGTFTNANGSTACTTCADGWTTAGEGATMCTIYSSCDHTTNTIYINKTVEVEKIVEV